MNNSKRNTLMRRCIAVSLVLVMLAGAVPGVEGATSAAKETGKKGVTAAAKETGKKSTTAAVKETEKNSERDSSARQKKASDSDKVGQYDLSVVETDYLTSHTDQSNVLTDEQVKAMFGNDAATGKPTVEDAKASDLTFSEEMYRKLGLVKENEDVVKNLQDMRTDESNQDVLAGMTMVDPQELMLGYINRENERIGTFRTINNMDANDIATIDSDYNNLQTNADVYKKYENNLNSGNKKYQCHNMVGIDIDGDGLDELAYLGIYYDKVDGKNQQCFVDIEIFKRKYYLSSYYGDHWEWVSMGTVVKEAISDKGNDFVSEMEVRSDLAYTSMAVGNFDGKDDGRKELAFYLPSKKKTNGKIDARVRVLSFGNDFKVSKSQDVYLRDINTDVSYLDKDWKLPIVSLSTTQTRLGKKLEDQSKTLSRYATHDDLVIGISVPGVYRDKYNGSYNPLNSWLSVYSFEGGAKALFKKQLSSYKDSDGKYSRMLGINTCDADLNGDGYKNLVVAGVKEEGIPDSKSQSHGVASAKKNLVNVLYVDKDGNYNLLWEKPKEVKAPGNLDVDNFTRAGTSVNPGSVLAPIALCAGHFSPGGPDVLDQLCIQGVILSAENTKVSGVPASVTKDKDGNIYRCILTDTTPGCEKENFPNEVSFKDIYTYDISKDETDDASTEAWVFAAYSGRFLNSSGTDTIVLLSSDVYPANHDHVYIDVNLISYYNAEDSSVAGFHYKAYDDFFHKKNEDGDGTSIFTGFVNSDLDTFYYRYTGTGSTYSAPVLQSIVQAPPYFEESNEAKVTYSVSTGYSRDNELGFNLSFGFYGGYEGEKLFKVEAEAVVSFGAHWGWTDEDIATQEMEVPCDDDYAVVLTIPVVENYYDVLYYDEVNNKYVKDNRVVTSPLSPIYTSLKLNEYNVIVESETKKTGNTFDAESSSPIIDASKLPSSSAGNPNGYMTKITDILNDDDMKDGEIKDNDYERAEVKSSIDEIVDVGGSIDFSHGNSRTLSGDLSGELKIGTKYGGFVFGAAADYAKCKTTTTGTSFSIGYDKLSNPIGGELRFVKNEKYKGLSSSIFHFGENDLSYNYSSTAVAHPLSDLNDAVKNKEAIKDDLLDSIHVLSFYVPVKGNPLPPEQPSAAAVQSVTENADSSLDVVLGWESSVKDENRVPDGYNIYRKDSNGVLHLMNITDGPVPRRTDSDYTTYALHIPGYERIDDEKKIDFYVVPAYVKHISGETQVKEGIPVRCCSVDNVSPAKKNLVITKQPQMVYIGDDLSGKTASFSVEASIKEKIKDRDVFYTWETYDSKTKTWNPVSATTVDEKELVADAAGEIKSSNTYTVEGDLKEKWDIPIRCTVNYGSYSYYSDIVAIEKHPFEAVKVSSIEFEDPGKLSATVAAPKEADSVRVLISTDKNFKEDVRSQLITDFKANRAKAFFKGLNKNKTYYLTSVPCKGLIQGEKGKVYPISPKKISQIKRKVLKKALQLKAKKKIVSVLFKNFKKLKKKYHLTAAKMLISTDKSGKKKVTIKTLKNLVVNLKKLKKHKKYFLHLQCYRKAGIVTYLFTREINLKHFLT